MKQDYQSKAVNLVKTYRTDYDSKVKRRKGQLKEITDETLDYFPQKEMDWDSNLKVNFMNQREHMVAAKMTAKNPKAIISIRQNPIEIAEEFTEGMDDEIKDIVYREIMTTWVPGIQSYFSMLFDTARFKSLLRRAAKQLVRTGNLYGKVVYHYDLYREKKKDGDNYKITEKSADEYPEVQLISMQELFFDPRYLFFEDMPAVIWRHEKVRLSQLKAMKDKEGMMNLDKIKYKGNAIDNPDQNQVYQIMFDNSYGQTQEEEAATLTVDEYYGYFSPDGDPEKEVLYELWVVNECLLVRARPITGIPIKAAACFEDPDQHFGTGLGEAMIGLQKEYNFKMNSAIQYINTNLNHTYLWDPNSGINPQMLMYANAPQGIIPVSKGMEAAQQGLQEVERRTIDSSYFSNQNEIRGDMETVSFSINALNSGIRPGSSETATGIKATYYDSNIVMQGLLRQFEEWLAEICYDIMECLVENYKGDKIVTGIGQNHYTWLDKEVFKKGKLRYHIQIDIGSSTFDSAENRREDALAKITILEKAQQAGLTPDLQAGYEDILSTFENVNVDRYFKEKDPMEEAMGMKGMGSMPDFAQTNQMPGVTNTQNFENMLGAAPDMSDDMSQAVVGNVIPPQ
jgi:hypothetical protein